MPGRRKRVLDEEAGGMAAIDRARAHGGRHTPRAVDRYRVILEAYATVGGWSRDIAEQLADEWGMAVESVQTDACRVNDFLELFEDVKASKPFITANLAMGLEQARVMGRPGDVAKLAEVLGKVSGAIQSGPAVSVLVDARTGALRPEVAQVIQASDAKLMEAARRAAERLGLDGDAFDEAFAAELDGGKALPG